MKQTPDEILSERILAEIEKKKLVSKKTLDKLRTMYIQGKITAEEWKLAVDLSTEVGESHAKQN